MRSRRRPEHTHQPRILPRVGVGMWPTATAFSRATRVYLGLFRVRARVRVPSGLFRVSRNTFPPCLLSCPTSIRNTTPERIPPALKAQCRPWRLLLLCQNTRRIPISALSGGGVAWVFCIVQAMQRMPEITTFGSQDTNRMLRRKDLRGYRNLVSACVYGNIPYTIMYVSLYTEPIFFGHVHVPHNVKCQRSGTSNDET